MNIELVCVLIGYVLIETVVILFIVFFENKETSEQTLKLFDGSITLPQHLAVRVKLRFDDLSCTTYEQVCDFLDEQLNEMQW